MKELFTAARERGVPILVIRTADQNATAEAIRVTEKDFPVVQWDAARGLTAMMLPDGKVDPKGAETLKRIGVTADAAQSAQLLDALMLAQKLPRYSVVIAHNAHLQLTSSEPIATAHNVQAVANVRDTFKRDLRMLVLLGPVFVTPPSLEHDVVVIDHVLPGPEELKAIVEELHVAAKLPKPSAEVIGKAVDAVRGLSSFAAEQVTAMSLRPAENGGLDLDALWERKRVTIEQTRGLRVWRGTERFADLVGLENIKANLRQQLTARMPIGVVVCVDEIDKVLANVEHDTSGVRMDQLRTLLTEMENNEWLGSVLMGVAGGGKSAIAKSFGNEAGVPTIALDLGDMEGPHVGESEAMLRHAMDVIKAVGSGNAFFLATSNNASVMRPELQRRFTEGMFFFDLMTREERDAAWKHYAKKYEIDLGVAAKDGLGFDDDGWTGAEIRNCCRRAWNARIPLQEAAKFIVPMARSRADEIEKLRQYAHNRLLDASKPGMYQYEAEPMARHARAIALPTQVVEAIGKMKES